MSKGSIFFHICCTVFFVLFFSWFVSDFCFHLLFIFGICLQHFVWYLCHTNNLVCIESGCYWKPGLCVMDQSVQCACQILYEATELSLNLLLLFGFFCVVSLLYYLFYALVTTKWLASFKDLLPSEATVKCRTMLAISSWYAFECNSICQTDFTVNVYMTCHKFKCNSVILCLYHRGAGNIMFWGCSYIHVCEHDIW